MCADITKITGRNMEPISSVQYGQLSDHDCILLVLTFWGKGRGLEVKMLEDNIIY